MIPSSLSEGEASKAKYYLDNKTLNFINWTKYKSFEYKLAYNGRGCYRQEIKTPIS